MGRRDLRSIGIALVAVLAAACSGGGGPDASRTTTISGGPTSPGSGTRAPVKIAVFQDLSNEDPTQLVMPSYLGLQLSLTEGAAGIPVAPELEAFDVEGDPARAVQFAQQVADDPSYVAAVISPFWAETSEVGGILDAAGVPTISLSALGPDLTGFGWERWRRLVPTQPHQADSLAALVEASANRRTGVCLVGSSSPYSTALSGLLHSRLRALVAKVIAVPRDGTPDPFGQTVTGIDAAGCRTVVWTGFAASGALLRTSLTDAGTSGVLMYGSDAVKDEPFLALTGAQGTGTVVTCPCADLSTSTDPAAQRFVHDYQSEFGSSPGPYAVEGWDLGSMLIDAFRRGATGRAAVSDAMFQMKRFTGLAGVYEWTDGGELAAASVQIHTFVDHGQRWAPFSSGANVDPAVPLPTEGLLTVAACRQGLPFNGQEAGRPAGFDVDLAAAIARNLGVRLGWQALSCDAARAALAAGRLDALIVSRDSLAQGTPTSRVALSVHTALVTRVGDATSVSLGSLGRADRVGVVAGPVTARWIDQVLAGPGAKVRRYSNPADAYDALVRGDITAVADTEYGAWAGIERRSSLIVAQTYDTGAHDVLITSGGQTPLLAAADGALGHLFETGRYSLIWAKWFPGSTFPPEAGN